jgi:hypothetical protein
VLRYDGLAVPRVSFILFVPVQSVVGHGSCVGGSLLVILILLLASALILRCQDHSESQISIHIQKIPLINNTPF